MMQKTNPQKISMQDDLLEKNKSVSISCIESNHMQKYFKIRGTFLYVQIYELYGFWQVVLSHQYVFKCRN